VSGNEAREHSGQLLKPGILGVVDMRTCGGIKGQIAFCSDRARGWTIAAVLDQFESLLAMDVSAWPFRRSVSLAFTPRQMQQRVQHWSSAGVSDEMGDARAGDRRLCPKRLPMMGRSFFLALLE